ncbi:MAG: hypothetical protein R3362_08225 [Rhodothermales bacterium]|nr:hypothetical protein [Rhodothermales bacterium]
MCPLDEFKKACPAGLCLTDRPAAAGRYKYYACGKGCTLGVLFEDSVNVYFEWLTEGGRVVDYPARVRYKFWTKREFARLVREGVWEPTAEPVAVAA